MSFTPRKLAYRPWPVTVTYQECDDAGQVSEIKQTFVAHFIPFSEEKIEELIAEANKKHPAADEGSVSLATQLLRNGYVFSSLIVGWGKEVRDELNKPIPFSPELLCSWVTGHDGMLITNGINVALGQIRFGHAPEKNSKTSPEPGLTQQAVEVGAEKSES